MRKERYDIIPGDLRYMDGKSTNEENLIRNLHQALINQKLVLMVAQKLTATGAPKLAYLEPVFGNRNRFTLIFFYFGAL